MPHARHWPVLVGLAHNWTETRRYSGCVSWRILVGGDATSITVRPGQRVFDSWTRARGSTSVADYGGPNVLVVLTDQLRYPLVYESQELRRLHRERMLGRHQDRPAHEDPDSEDGHVLA